MDGRSTPISLPVSYPLLREGSIIRVRSDTRDGQFYFHSIHSLSTQDPPQNQPLPKNEDWDEICKNKFDEFCDEHSIQFILVSADHPNSCSGCRRSIEANELRIRTRLQIEGGSMRRWNCCIDASCIAKAIDKYHPDEVTRHKIE